MLLLLEDAHWSDQTTQSLIERLLKRVDREQALVLITYRPELTTNWSEHPQATLITCKQIGDAHCALLIRNVANRLHMDEALIQEIVARSDGVPCLPRSLPRLSCISVRLLQASCRLHCRIRLWHAWINWTRQGRRSITSVFGRQFTYTLLLEITGASDDELGAAWTACTNQDLFLGPEPTMNLALVLTILSCKRGPGKSFRELVVILPTNR